MRITVSGETAYILKMKQLVKVGDNLFWIKDVVCIASGVKYEIYLTPVVELELNPTDGMWEIVMHQSG